MHNWGRRGLFVNDGVRLKNSGCANLSEIRCDEVAERAVKDHHDHRLGLELAVVTY